MEENKYLLDANAILRFLLQDIEEQFRYVRAAIRNNNCYITLEVLAEVCYVLEGLYQVSREDSVKNKFFTRQICAYAQIRRGW